jgi:hypothetical protein
MIPEDDDWFTKYLVAKQLIPKGGDDDIQTPQYLANQIVKYFLPLIDAKSDLVLEFTLPDSARRWFRSLAG